MSEILDLIRRILGFEGNSEKTVNKAKSGGVVSTGDGNFIVTGGNITNSNATKDDVTKK